MIGSSISCERTLMSWRLPDGKGTELNFRMMSETVSTFRACGTVSEACLDEIRKDMKNRDGRR